MILFLGVLLVPLLIGIGAYFLSKQICLKEMACMVGVQIVVAGVSAAICYHQTLSELVISMPIEYASGLTFIV